MRRLSFRDTRKSNPLSSRRKIVLAVGTLSILALIVIFFALRGGPGSFRATEGQPVTSLKSLIAMSDAERATMDVGLMNLLCSEDLPDAGSWDRSTLLKQLDEWADRIRVETRKHFHRFQFNPAEFENSEAYFRLVMMTVVVQEDFKVRYNPARANAAEGSGFNDGFFKDSRDVFIHGLLTGEREGTCSSIPVLYAALGRRLGYPIKLATTKGHLFVRWESPTERFNAEVTNHGLSRFDDDYYRHWPFEVSDEEIKAEGYLKSLNTNEELAVFLSTRGLCLLETGRDAWPTI